MSSSLMLSPHTVDELTTSAIDLFTTHLYSRNLAPSTIAGYLRYARCAVRWAFDRSMLAELPKFTMPKEADRAGGRPLLGEEFDRMLTTCERLRLHVSSSWEFLLAGLWWSGLRLSQALALTWDEHGLLTMDLTGNRPMFFIRAELSKNRKDQRFPMSPEFFQMLSDVPDGRRRQGPYDDEAGECHHLSNWPRGGHCRQA